MLQVDCDCGSTYQPVCDQTSLQTYFSPCSAGCQTRLNSSTFQDCSCLASPTSSLVAGYCPSDCNTPLMAFLVTQFLLNFILGLGRVGNLLVHVRCVEKRDKALGMAVQEISLALIAFIPGELMFGWLVDSACLPGMWTTTGCGQTGNCLGYDLQDFRQSGDLSLVQIHPDTVLSLVEIILLLRQHSYAYLLGIFVFRSVFMA